MSIFYVRHEIVVDKFHEVISFKQSKWFKTYKIFITQNRKLAKNDFERTFFNFLNIEFYGKTRDNIKIVEN